MRLLRWQMFQGRLVLSHARSLRGHRDVTVDDTGTQKCYPSAMDVAKYYRELLGRRITLLDECVADASAFAMHVASHNALKDFDTLLSCIVGLEKTVFSQACREYQYSIEAAVFGNYRHAFSSLRLSFELYVASVYFSAHQMKLKLWLMGHLDLNWALLVDGERGVFSHDFVKAFNADMGSYRAQYMTLATKVYRECSEYVHGNPSTHEEVDSAVVYDPKKARDFHDKAFTVKLCVMFLFIVRYTYEMSQAEKNRVELMIIEEFGDLPEIQASFGGAAR